jgi:hypothetical protein
LQVEIHVHPVLIGVFPLFGAAALLLLLPPILYLSFRQEFGALHPMWPPHYLFLVRRLLRALSGNKQLKVRWMACCLLCLPCLLFMHCSKSS